MAATRTSAGETFARYASIKPCGALAEKLPGTTHAPVITLNLTRVVRTVTKHLRRAGSRWTGLRWVRSRCSMISDTTTASLYTSLLQGSIVFFVPFSFEKVFRF